MIDLHGYGPRLAEGALVTVELAVLSLILAIVLGLATASAKMSRNWVLHRLGTLYTTLIRGVPDLVLMMLLFFGGRSASTCSPTGSTPSSMWTFLSTSMSSSPAWRPSD